MIEFIQIFGERCSGTNYIENLICKNYNISITTRFGWKHWCIDFKQFTNANTNTSYDDVLFIIIVRNPYDQLRSLSLEPHHAPFHYDISFSEFLRREWKSYESEHHTWFHPDINERNKCIQEGELIEHEKNVCILRNKKNKNFLELKNYVKYFLVINYEDILFDYTSIKVIENFEIQRKTKDKINITNQKGIHEETFKMKEYNLIQDEDILFINVTLDWSVEKQLGYTMSF